MKKAQVALEFLILTVFVLIIFTGLVVIINARIISLQEAREENNLEQVADVIKSEIDIALNVNTGYQRTISFPKTLDTFDYEIDQLVCGKNNDGNCIKIYYTQDPENLQASFLIPPQITVDVQDKTLKISS